MPTKIQPVAAGEAQEVLDDGIDAPNLFSYVVGDLLEFLLFLLAFSRGKFTLEPLNRHADAVERVANFVCDFCSELCQGGEFLGLMQAFPHCLKLRDMPILSPIEEAHGKKTDGHHQTRPKVDVTSLLEKEFVGFLGFEPHPGLPDDLPIHLERGETPRGI